MESRKLTGGPVENGDGLFNGEVCIAIVKNYDAAFIIRAVNSYDELVKIAQAYRNLLRTMAHDDGEVATFHHIESVLAPLEGKEVA